MPPERALIHLARTERRVVDPDDIHFVEASGGSSLVRLRGRRPLVDIRPLGELEPMLTAAGIVRIHRRPAPTSVPEPRPAAVAALSPPVPKQCRVRERKRKRKLERERER